MGGVPTGKILRILLQLPENLVPREHPRESAKGFDRLHALLMCRSLHLVLAYAIVNSAHAFLALPLSSAKHCIDKCAASSTKLRSFLTRPQQRHCTLHSTSRTARSASTMSSGTVWPPADRLSEYVTESSLVDYVRLSAQEIEWLAPVIDNIKTTDPRTLDTAERHAFLINAYNLWTLHWVIRERRSPRFKGVVSTLAKARFFYWHKIYTGAGKRNLYDFENKVGHT